MVFFNLIFIVLYLFLFLFSVFIFYVDYLTNNFNLIVFESVYNFIPLSNDYLYILTLISFLFVFSIHYSVFKRFSPRWRVFKANKEIIKIRNGISKSIYKKEQVIPYLRKIDPFVFEEMLLSLFYERGFDIKRNKRYTGDGGSDGIIIHKKYKAHIQAKRYKSYINISHMNEFIELNRKFNTRGIFVHTGKTGSKTSLLAKENNIEIISGEALIRFVLGYEIIVFTNIYIKKRKIKNK